MKSIRKIKKNPGNAGRRQFKNTLKIFTKKILSKK